MRAKSPLVPTKPLARRRGVLGRRSRFSTALQPPLPRRGACAIIVPTWRLNCRCPSARRGGVGVGVEVRGASSQRWLCRVPLGGVGVVPCSFQRRLRGLPTPAPDWFVRRPFALLGLFPLRSNRLIPQKLPLLAPSGAVRGLRWSPVRCWRGGTMTVVRADDGRGAFGV